MTDEIMMTLVEDKSSEDGVLVSEELLAWWESFLAQKRKEDANDEDVRSTWEDSGQRRVKYIREVRLLSEMFEPVKVKVQSILKADHDRRGDRLYREWCMLRRKECLLSYYDNPVFRAIYTNYRFLSSATTFLQALINRIIPDNPLVEEFIRRKLSRIITIGVGPGADIAALLSFCRCRGYSSRLVFYALDQSEGWNDLLSIFDRHWGLVHGFSVWFKNCRFGKRDDVASLPDADMVVFSFANTPLMDKAIWPLMMQRYPFILVLDGMKNLVVTNLGEAGFQSFRLSEKTTVYYHFDMPPQNDAF